MATSTGTFVTCPMGAFWDDVGPEPFYAASMQGTPMLDELMANAWRPLTEEVHGGWRYRWSIGVTRRAMRHVAHVLDETGADDGTMSHRAGSYTPMGPVDWGTPVGVDTDSEGFALPTGTVSLLLADIEASTRYWEDEDDRGLSPFDDFVGAVREIIGRCGGAQPLEQGEGDSFVAAFSRASDAVSCALALQTELSDSPVRIRIGVHTGEVLHRADGSYAGTTINRAARLRDIGHGGQVVLSATTRDLVLDGLPDGAWLSDLGLHHLRDLARPEHVFQLGHTALRTDFPPLRSLGSYEHNLPPQRSSLIGRRDELAWLEDVLPRTRLVTLTGSGGCGKTRLALQHAADALESREATWFVDLSTTTPDDPIADPIAAAVGVLEAPVTDPLDAVVWAIDSRQVLLVLDNCEQVVDAVCNVVERILRDCPSARVLATSREPLRLEGERAFRVPSLSLPDPFDDPARIDSIGHSEAVQLFVTRAQQVRHDFELTTENAAHVARICRRLDGIPLAIELAAGRVRVLPPHRIAEGLDEAFRFLAGGSRTAVPRQQTLQASIDWSHQLLDGESQVLLRRLSVFAARFQLPDVEAVCGFEPLDPYTLLDLVEGLVDRSLVCTVAGDEPIYRLTEVVRAYARLRLVDASEAERARRNLVDYVIGRATDHNESAAGSFRWEFGHRQPEDVVAALSWLAQRDDWDAAGRVALAMSANWANDGPHHVGIEWIERVMDHVTDLPRDLHDGLEVALASVLGPIDPARSVMMLLAALPKLRGAESPETLGSALLAMGEFANMASQFDVAVRHLEEARSLDLPEGELLARIIAAQATVAYNVGGDSVDARIDVSRRLGAEASAVARRAGLEGAERYSLAFEVVSGPMGRGGFRETIEKADRYLALSRSSDGLRDWIVEATRWSSLCWVGDEVAALDAARRLDAFARATGTPWTTYALFVEGDGPDLVERFEASIRRGDELTVGLDLGPAFIAALRHGDAERARRWYDQLLSTPAGSVTAMLVMRHCEPAIFATAGDASGAMACATGHLTDDSIPLEPYGAAIFDAMASAAVQTDRMLDAATLRGIADVARERLGQRPLWVFDATELLRFQVDTALADHEDRAATEKALASGRSMSLEQAVHWAVRGRGTRDRPMFGWDSLTPTEHQVVEHVAAGLTNKDVARELHVSPRTVQSHLRNIFAKVGVSTRTELATMWAGRD